MRIIDGDALLKALTGGTGSFDIDKIRRLITKQPTIQPDEPRVMTQEELAAAQKTPVWRETKSAHKYLYNGWMLAYEILLKTQKLAYWVEETDRERHWHCSNCGTVQGIASVSMKYCPECGAQMEEHPWAASGCGQTFCPGKDE